MIVDIDQMRGERIMKQILGNVVEHGLAVLEIFPVKPEDGSVFTYTVGFAAHGLPEVIAFLPASIVHPAMNRYFDEIVNQKTRFAGPSVLTVADNWFNMDVSVINCDPNLVAPYGVQATNMAEFLNWPRAHFVQWVFPDTAGRLPWQEGFEERFNEVQPLLGRFV